MENINLRQVTGGAHELFKSVMKLYWSYLAEIDEVIRQLPEGNQELLNVLNQQIDEVRAAIDHDVHLFEKAIQSDQEGLSNFRDELKIHSIYEKLNLNE